MVKNMMHVKNWADGLNPVMMIAAGCKQSVFLFLPVTPKDK